jgi:hypothetical protein
MAKRTNDDLQNIHIKLKIETKYLYVRFDQYSGLFRIRFR